MESLPAAGKLGSRVKILGTDLTGAISVTFNGTAAVFTVTSPTLITTTVPTGATTGNIQVVTPSGTLSSNVPSGLRRVGEVHEWRSRRSRCGELVQWDTSTHDWLEGRGERIYRLCGAPHNR